MQRGREAANLGSLGLGAGRQPPTDHRAALARGWGAGRAESGLTQGHEEGLSTSTTSFPGLQTLCSSAPRSPNTPRPTWGVLLSILLLQGLLGNTERARIMPRLAGILSMGREGFLRVG